MGERLIDRLGFFVGYAVVVVVIAVNVCPGDAGLFHGGGKAVQQFPELVGVFDMDYTRAGCVSAEKYQIGFGGIHQSLQGFHGLCSVVACTAVDVGDHEDTECAVRTEM